MMKRVFVAVMLLLAFVACSKEHIEDMPIVGDSLKACVEVEAVTATVRSYDENLKWDWESDDALVAYQMAGEATRNTLTLVEKSRFRCDEFQYATNDAASFHFIYPAAAEVAHGVLTATQDGSWRPVAVATVANATVNDHMSVNFMPLSAALEVRVWKEDKSTRKEIVTAILSSDDDFVGQWTMQEDMTYSQSMRGKEIAIENISSDVVAFNMPVCESGFAADALRLTMFDVAGNTTTINLPAMTFVAGKRTILNAVFKLPTFTCATYNVDGLPSIANNSDGPGSSGTTTISQKIATQNWDFVGFSEDFDNHDELMSALSSTYTFGTYRGTVSVAQVWGQTADTDGLGFATRNATCSFLSESWSQFAKSYGGLSSGANTCIKKGIRHYPVQLADGVVVDVLITHMNTYSSSGSGHIDAQHAQLTEVAEYINATMAANDRPIIFMGDTNCRYTRNDFQQYFWSVLGEDLTYADPWVEFQWAGVYPTYPSNSLMVSDATGTSDTDIICENTQKGEVVDKVIYINKKTNAIQIKANSYLRDYDNFNGLADHMPIVVEFSYEKQVQ